MVQHAAALGKRRENGERLCALEVFCGPLRIVLVGHDACLMRASSASEIARGLRLALVMQLPFCPAGLLCREQG
jgi:hypothetical protein